MAYNLFMMHVENILNNYDIVGVIGNDTSDYYDISSELYYHSPYMLCLDDVKYYLLKIFQEYFGETFDKNSIPESMVEELYFYI